MKNISIDNTQLIPRLENGWVLSKTQERVDLDNVSRNERFEINAATVQIVEMCDGTNTLDEIINLLVAQYPEASTDIQTDVENVIQELQEHHAIAFTLAKQQTEVFVIPERTPKKDKRKLCIGMATYDDYDGVYFSIQAIRMYHPEILKDVEFVVVDNHPDGPCAEALKALESWIKNYRYIPCNNIRGNAVKDIVFREANADFVLCMDSHVFMAPNSLKSLMDYAKAHPNCIDLLQGPLLNDDFVNLSSHFNPIWSGGMYGAWGYDERAKDINGEAFDIPMQGCGTFCCAKSAWLGFNPRFAGFGGEEGYIHEKFRQAGGRTLCLPFFRWLHRFNRPLGTRYEVSWEDRIRNYMIGLDENQLEMNEMIAHFEEHVGKDITKNTVEKINAELASPLYQFDAIYCIQNKKTSGNTLPLEAHHILRRIKFHTKLTPEDESFEQDHLAILQEAKTYNFNSVLILHSPNALPPSFEVSSVAAITALQTKNWRSCVFKSLETQQSEPVNIAAVAYHHQIYDELLLDSSSKNIIQENINKPSLSIDI